MSPLEFVSDFEFVFVVCVIVVVLLPSVFVLELIIINCLMYSTSTLFSFFSLALFLSLYPSHKMCDIRRED